jgi:hypothetical protein
LQVEDFDYFEKLLCHTLQSQWNNIINDGYDSDTYVNPKGVVPGVIRGCNLAAIKPCYMRSVKLFGPQDSAKRMQLYMAINTIINTDIVSVHQGIGRMQELNKILPYMPYLCYKQDSPSVIQVVTEYTPLEMCTHVLAIIPLKLNMTYHAGV